MNSTLYALFTDQELAENATGALLDLGIRPDDISLLIRSDPERPADLSLASEPEARAIIFDSGVRQGSFDPLNNRLRQGSPLIGGITDLSLDSAFEDLLDKREMAREHVIRRKHPYADVGVEPPEVDFDASSAEKKHKRHAEAAKKGRKAVSAY